MSAVPLSMDQWHPDAKRLATTPMPPTEAERRDVDALTIKGCRQLTQETPNQCA